MFYFILFALLSLNNLQSSDFELEDSQRLVRTAVNLVHNPILSLHTSAAEAADTSSATEVAAHISATEIAANNRRIGRTIARWLALGETICRAQEEAASSSVSIWYENKATAVAATRVRSPFIRAAQLASATGSFGFRRRVACEALRLVRQPELYRGSSAERIQYIRRAAAASDYFRERLAPPSISLKVATSGSCMVGRKLKLVAKPDLLSKSLGCIAAAQAAAQRRAKIAEAESLKRIEEEEEEIMRAIAAPNPIAADLVIIARAEAESVKLLAVEDMESQRRVALAEAKSLKRIRTQARLMSVVGNCSKRRKQ